ncbi:MAG: hypothetical protein HZA95_02335 [Candidatus Vogelbacteria bacterium]|nr:hypothetical protein [Candidatus Vogelbacteria bacterium]
MSDNKKPEELGRIENARSDFQRGLMEGIARGKCTFCPPLHPVNIVLWESPRKLWQVWDHPCKYPHQANQVMLVAIPHWTDADEITDEGWIEFGEGQRFIKKHFNLTGRNLVMRSGDFDLTSATIAHLHCQVQVPDKTGPCIAVFYKDNSLTTYLEIVTGAFKKKRFGVIGGLYDLLLRTKNDWVKNGKIEDVNLGPKH